MTREEAILLFEISTPKECSGCYKARDFTCSGADARRCEAYRMAISALREQEVRSKACPYCDIAKANDGVRNTALWVKEPETNKWTMMGKKLLFCPMCGRRLEDT